jgi:hypothetical protein
MGERREQRRRLKERLRTRERLLLDLGALVYELHRQGRRAPELLQAKAAELTIVDDDVRALQDQLEGIPPQRRQPQRFQRRPQADPSEETAESDAVFEEEPAQ